MKKIKLYEEFLSESKNETLIQKILVSLEPQIQDLLSKYILAYEDKAGKKMSLYDKELTKLNIIYDMVKSIEIYTQSTDTLINISSSISSKGNLEITAQIQRDNQIYDFNTEVIYAGGYNIQALHYRYLTKTNIPKTGNKTIATEYANKIKKLSKLEKYNLEIEKLKERINLNTIHINKSQQLSDSDILKLLINNDEYRTLTVTWSEIVKRGADKNYKNQEDFEQQQKMNIENSINNWKKQNIQWKLNDTQSAETQIQQITNKLQKMI